MPIRSARLVKSLLAVSSFLAFACSRVTASGAASTAQPHKSDRVIIDGATDEDWGATAHRVLRALNSGDTTAAAEITTVAERQDAHYVYLRIDLARAVSLYGLPGTVSLDFDADGNESTGAEIDSLRGTDFSIDLSPTTNGKVSEGAALRIMRAGAVVKTRDTYALDFVMLPTYAASHVELRIARGRILDSARAPGFAGHSYRAQIAVHDPSGAVRYRLPAFTAALTTLDTTRTETKTDPLARAPSTQFRALIWNVANEGIRDRPERFRRIIAAIDPDLLVLDEVGGVLRRDGVRQFLASLDSGKPRRPDWQFTYGGGGGYQRTVIATRTSVTEFPEFQFIKFPDSVTQSIVAAMPAALRARQRANIDSGLATGGAVVTLGGKRVAVFGVDLQSAGNPATSWQEMRRRAEARLVRDQAMAAIRALGPVDGVIAAGDHNLVSTREPLTILGAIGQAFDGSPLKVAAPLQLDSATAATWEGLGGPFPPGRLDWFSYSGRTMEVLGGFVFDAADLGERWRAVHHLQHDDSKTASDHRPVVIDLRWRNH